MLVLMLLAVGTTLLIAHKARLALILTIAATWAAATLGLFCLAPSEIAGWLVFFVVVLPLGTGAVAGGMAALLLKRRPVVPIVAAMVGALLGSVVELVAWALSDFTLEESIRAASVPAVLAACVAVVVAATAETRA